MKSGSSCSAPPRYRKPGNIAQGKSGAFLPGTKRMNYGSLDFPGFLPFECHRPSTTRVKITKAYKDVLVRLSFVLRRTVPVSSLSSLSLRASPTVRSIMDGGITKDLPLLLSTLSSKAQQHLSLLSLKGRTAVISGGPGWHWSCSCKDIC